MPTQLNITHMQLQPGEQSILTSNGNLVTLTNLRVAGNFKDWGYSHKIFIYLEDISSIQVVYRSIVLLLGLAAICGLYGLYAVTQNYMEHQAIMGIGGALLFLVLWWFSRGRVIAIYPDGGKPLEVAANTMKEQAVDDFME